MRYPLAALALLLVLVCAGPAAPADIDLYRVTDIPVDATAESGVAARQMALETGQREGLRQLLRRLTLPEGEARLPPVEGLDVDRFVQSFEIASEKVAPTRYLATLNVTYAPEPVDALLRGSGVGYLERPPDPVVILPVLVTAEGVDLWGEQNPWRLVWNAGVPSPVVDIRLPLGDAGDVSLVTPETAGSDPAALAALAERYGAADVFLAEARPEGGVEAPTAITLAVHRSGPDAQVLLQETVRPAPDEDSAALWKRAALRTVEAVSGGIKRRLIAPVGATAAVTVGVPLVDLGTWVQIRQALGALPEVQSLRVERFNRAEAVITIAYTGDIDQLVAAVRRAGLSLAEESGAWQLRQVGGPAAL
jgi:hypothetical protein